MQDKNVLFDENYLDLIANNLLSNAFKYTEVGESITVKLYIEGDNLVLQVIDTGIGIPLEKQEKIFERFYQVENGREGSGIGLSLVQRLVELHHGRIILQSEVGKGSTFTIYLPQDESVYTQEELLGGSGNEGEQRVYSTNANACIYHLQDKIVTFYVKFHSDTFADFGIFKGIGEAGKDF